MGFWQTWTRFMATSKELFQWIHSSLTSGTAQAHGWLHRNHALELFLWGYFGCKTICVWLGRCVTVTKCGIQSLNVSWELWMCTGICVITFANRLPLMNVVYMQIKMEIQTCNSKRPICLLVHAGTLSQETRTTLRMSLYEQVNTSELSQSSAGTARLPVNIQLRKEQWSTLTQPRESFWWIPPDVSKSESRHAACSLEVGLFTRLLVLTGCKTSHWVRSFYCRGDSCISPSFKLSCRDFGELACHCDLCPSPVYCHVFHAFLFLHYAAGCHRNLRQNHKYRSVILSSKAFSSAYWWKLVQSVD